MKSALCLAASLLSAWPMLRTADPAPVPKPAGPKPVTLEGRVVDLGEELAKAYKADKSDRAKEPLLGLKTSDGFYVLLRNRDSERFWRDARLRGRDIVLNARLFPDSRIIEVFTVQRRDNGKLLDVYYWCDICSIRTVTDDDCPCCQGPVELRETPAEKR